MLWFLHYWHYRSSLNRLPTVYTELLDNGKPPERMGRKAAGLNLLVSGRQGSRAVEGKRLPPPRIRRLSKLISTEDSSMSKRSNISFPGSTFLWHGYRSNPWAECRFRTFRGLDSYHSCMLGIVFLSPAYFSPHD